jgi:hypothetical protein
MNLSSELIDRIVQNVIRELQARAVTGGTASAAAVTAEVGQPRPLLIDHPVITEDVLATAQAAGRLVSLPSGAVLTPSGRDYIRKHGVRLSSAVAARQESRLRGLLITVGTVASATAAAVATGWKTDRVSVETDAVPMALQHAAEGRVICGGEPSIVACLLNRESGLRAAVVTKQTDLAALQTAMNPQVICFASEGWSYADVRRLLQSLKSPLDVPAGWNERPAGGVR